MLNLADFRTQAYRLADWLPWACLIAPGVIPNKDGSFQRTIRYRGPDLDSATEAELMSVRGGFEGRHLGRASAGILSRGCGAANCLSVHPRSAETCTSIN
jgi:hypothetical protein